MDGRWKSRRGSLFAMPLILVLTVGITLSPFPAGSEPRGNEARSDSPSPTKSSRARIQDDPKRSLKMQEIEILGEVEKPKTMFVIPRAPHSYYWEKNTKDFTEEILAPINKQEMEDMQRWREATSLP